MQDNRLRIALAVLMITVFALVIIVIGMAEGSFRQGETPDMGVVQTQAIATFLSQMTQTADKAPTVTATLRPPPTEAVSATAPTSSTPNCLGLRFLRDVTIPDNTAMTPAEVFTKTWLVENNGTCAWRPGFQIVLIGGLAMGGSPFRVAQTVGPGGSIQVSIKMAAPTNQTGVVQGTWMITDAEGARFGDFLSVVIVVGAPTRGAVTQAPSPAPSRDP